MSPTPVNELQLSPRARAYSSQRVDGSIVVNYSRLFELFRKCQTVREVPGFLVTDPRRCV